MWLGAQNGYLQDWLTQQWVKVFGKKVDINDYQWLFGPIGHTDVINDKYIEELIQKENLTVRKNEPGFGLMDSMEALDFSEADYKKLNKKVIDFYEHTFDYDLEIWSHWCGFYQPFGWLLRLLFSKRLQQLNLPLNPLESSRGFRSSIIKLFENGTNETKYTIWYRILKSRNEVIYSGIYDKTYLPSQNKTVLKIIFPLPNGSATVIMDKHVLPDGSLKIISKGSKIGDPGFYFTLTNGDGKYWTKYVKAMHEYIHVYEDNEQVLRADHILTFYKTNFLKLHYKMVKINH